MNYSGNDWMNITWGGVSDGTGSWNGTIYEYICTVTSDSISIEVNDTIQCLKTVSCERIESGSTLSSFSENDSFEDEILYNTITLNKDNGWSYTFTNLPLTGADKDGNPVTYYYYIEEVSVPNYDTTYENNGGIQSGTITVTNKATENSDITLPETGGSGTTTYIMGGILLMLASVLLYIKQYLKEGRRKYIRR